MSLGAELLARPCLLYIDEATSGLDAGTEARMMGLFRQLSDEGRSVICITHNVDNVSSSHLVLFLMRGRLIFFGPPKDAVAHFEVARLGDIYDRLAEKSPEHWEEAFNRTDLHQEFVRKRLKDPTSAESDLLANNVKPTGEYCLLPDAAGVAPLATTKEPERTFRPPLWHQFKILTQRYADLILGDRRSLRLLLLQAPIVAIVVLFGFANKPYDDLVPVPRKLEPSERSTLEAIEEITNNNEFVIAPADRELLERWRWPVKGGAETISAMEILTGLRKFQEARVIQKLLEVNGPVVPDRNMINPRFTYMLLFLIAVIVMWFGCNNAAKEIVKEEAIYGRERAVNLGILPYLGQQVSALEPGIRTANLLARRHRLRGHVDLAESLGSADAQRHVYARLSAAIWRAGAVGDDRRCHGLAAFVMRGDARSGQQPDALRSHPADHIGWRVPASQLRAALLAFLRSLTCLLGLSGDSPGRQPVAAVHARLCRRHPRSYPSVRCSHDPDASDAGSHGLVLAPQGCPASVKG